MSADPKHPIISIEIAGGVIAQGPTVDAADVRRGSLPVDMHGRIAVDTGGSIAVGRPIPSFRNLNRKER